MAWWCKQWNALPEAGGLHDQDYVLMRRMSELDTVYHTVVKLRSARGAQIHQLTHGEQVVVQQLREMGLL